MTASTAVSTGAIQAGWRRHGSAFTILGLLLFLFAAIRQPGAQERLSEAERSWLDARQEVVFVGQESYPPFEFVHPGRGEYTGMAIELIRWISTEFGFNAVFLPMPFASAQQAVQDGDADALTGIFLSEERQERLDFTQEVFAVPASIFVRTERTDILELEDLKGRKVAVQRGDYAIEFLRGQNLEVSFLYTDDFPSALRMVDSGEADALIGDEQIIMYYLYSADLSATIKRVAHPLYTGSDRMAVTKGNEILLSILDKGLSHAKSTGTFDKIYEKWLGTTYSNGKGRFDHWIMPLIAAIGILVVIALTALAWTLQLNRLVHKKTAELRDLNLELKNSNDQLTAANAQLVRDMEERARMEEERRRLETRMIKAQNYESLALLAGGVARDFSNLLTALIGNIDAALVDGRLQGEVREHLTAATATALQAGELAKHLLDFSGRTAGSRETVNLSAMVASMTKVLEAASPLKIPLRFQLEEQGVTVRGDPVQLRQVIVNLVLNAVESYESSTDRPDAEQLVSVRVGIQDLDQATAAAIRAGQDLPPGRYACIEVTDRGCGVQAELMGSLFDPYFSTKKNGRGLGLAALAGIVQVHAGAIAVRSIPGQTTVFSVLLPLANQSRAASVSTSPVSAELRLKGTILLVDDQDGVRKATARMLESLGLRVAQASNYENAAEQLQEKGDRIDCILLDLTIGRQDNQDSLRRVRELAGNIPIILTTVYGATELQSQREFDGLAGILEKPYDRPMLERILLAALPELGKTQT